MKNWGYQDYAYALSNRNKTDWETDRRYWKEHLSPLPEPLLLPHRQAPDRKILIFRAIIIPTGYLPK